jgi:DNA polymerase-4
MPRVIFHIDMDAFYASVEQRDNPDLRARPVIVGAPPDRRGVVCAASYEARAFGVRSAMPARTAQRLCPDGVFLYPRMDAYRAESHAVMALLGRFGGKIEQVSVDEAYLDLSHHFEAFDAATATALGEEMKSLILTERHLTASIGIGPNKLLAKIASDHGKPDGLFCITEEEKVAFLRSLPASAIHGVGKVTAEALGKMGLRTIGDIQDYKCDLRAVAVSFAPKLKAYAFGEDERPLDLDGEIKSISAEETFDRDTQDRRVLVLVLKEQAGDISAKLTKERLAARTVQVKVRCSDFKTLADPADKCGGALRIPRRNLRDRLCHPAP